MILQSSALNIIPWGDPRLHSVVANVMDCDIIVGEFELKSHH